jgi:uncharacterized protein (DUF1330 family)
MTTLKGIFGSTLALGLAAVAPQALQAQPRTPAYVITEIDVTDAAAFAEYAPKVQPSFAPFSGRYVVRGGKTQSLTGDAPKRVVVLAFDSMDQARAWYDSPQYEALKALRDKAGKARIFAVEGAAP